MLIAMHLLELLCDKYFLSYYGFSTFFMGRSRYRVVKDGEGVKWHPRRTAAYVPSHFHGFEPIFCYVSPKIVIFHGLLIVETCNRCHWIQHALNPTYVPLRQFQCIFPSQNQQNVKFWQFPELPLKKTEKKTSICAEKKCLQSLQICTHRFLGMLIAMHC